MIVKKEVKDAIDDIRSSSSYSSMSKYISSSRIKVNDTSPYDSKELNNYIRSYSSTSIKDKISFYLTKEGLQILGLHMRRGVSYKELAHIIGVGINTLMGWKKKYPQINQVLSYTREVMIAEVESAALRTAKGYTVSLIRPMVLKKLVYDDDNKIIGVDETIDYVAYEEHVKPDVNAQRLILNNAYPEVYKADSKQLAEALNQKQLGVVQELQKGFITKLEEISMQDLANESVVVIENDESINDSGK